MGRLWVPTPARDTIKGTGGEMGARPVSNPLEQEGDLSGPARSALARAREQGREMTLELAQPKLRGVSEPVSKHIVSNVEKAASRIGRPPVIADSAVSIGEWSACRPVRDLLKEQAHGMGIARRNPPSSAHREQVSEPNRDHCRRLVSVEKL